LTQNSTKKLDVNDYSCAHLTLILLLHYFVKFKSRTLAVYSNELILGNTCVSSEIINRIATNMNNGYYSSESVTCYTTLFLLLHVLKMFPSARTQTVDVDATRQQHVQ